MSPKSSSGTPGAAYSQQVEMTARSSNGSWTMNDEHECFNDTINDILYNFNIRSIFLIQSLDPFYNNNTFNTRSAKESF